METDRSIAIPRRSQEHPLLAVKRFDAPETVLTFAQGRFEVVSIGDRRIAKGSYAPGWRWSQIVASPPARRISGPVSPPRELAGVVLTGRVKIRIPDGPEVDLTPGDFFHVAVDHESWVVGYRPCEVLYFDGVEEVLGRLRTNGSG